MKQLTARRLLLVRMDRIGDLILTLPVDEALKGVEATWWVTNGLGFIAEAARPRRRAREFARKIGIFAFFKLLAEVRRERYEAAILFHGPWWVSLLFWLARIPLRGGVKSQWHSFLFLNRAVRQRRSRAEASELEYGFQLVEKIFELEQGSLHRSSLKLEGATDGARVTLLKNLGLIEGQYTIVHPGMGGSALNWPSSHYAALIRELCARGPVVITGTASDEPYLAPLRKELSGQHSVIWLDGKLAGKDLITALAAARAIVAPSTGVLHLAASTGRPTLGLFSPVRVQQPRRWGPQGERVKTLMPMGDCPGEMSCLGQDCKRFDCMATISPSDALKELDRL